MTVVLDLLMLVAGALIALVPSSHHAPHGAAGARCSVFNGETTCVYVERP